mmetsp:Transcript_57166/g.161396  ORF Transcript_57166/g.161396 Transcript_57166/m.161396 type:complete len:231 (-) Transcript_57166:755-1447(-)
MSRPRAATSVQTRMPHSPVLPAVMMRNLWSTSSRTSWTLPLWMLLHQCFSLLFWTSSSSWSHPSFVAAKTMAVSPGWRLSRSTLISRGFFSSGRRTSTVCSMFSFAVSLSPPAPWPMLTCVAFPLVRDRAIDCTSLGHVAVKNRVWRPWPAASPRASGLAGLGHIPTILRMSGSKPMSSMRSASSKTSFSTRSKFSWPPSRKSLTRPGVPITPWTPARSSRSCSCLGAPP